MSDRALLGRRGDDRHVAEPQQFLTQGTQTGGINTVVVGQKYSHSLLRGSAFQRLASEDVVIMLGEAVGFVADVLKEPQRRGVAIEPERLGVAGAVDFLLALGQG